MSVETPFTKVARIEQQYSLEGRGSGRLDGSPRLGYDVISRKIGATTIYRAYRDGTLENHDIVQVTPLAPDLLNLDIERPSTDMHVVAALTQIALFEYMKAWKDVRGQNGEGAKVVSFIALGDNPESNSPLQPLFGDVLGMEGMSVYTDQNEVVYAGDLAEVHGNALHSLRQSRPPLSIQSTLPAKAA